MPLDHKEIYLGVLSQMDLSPLPESALRFLCDYLDNPSPTGKVSSLLSEAMRLHHTSEYDEDYTEAIKYKE